MGPGSLRTVFLLPQGRFLSGGTEQKWEIHLFLHKNGETFSKCNRKE
jgi:hypothetical protein